MRGCKGFFVVASALVVVGFLLGISFPAIGAEQGKANANPTPKETGMKRSAGSCTYTAKLDNSDQIVYMPAGKDCEQLLKDFTSQAKSCCICKKEGPGLMSCKGDCCPIMFSKVEVRRNASARPSTVKSAETVQAKPAETAPAKPVAAGAAPAKPVEAAPAKPAATGPAPAKPSASTCKYTTKMENSGQVVSIPSGSECEQLLRVFSSQNKPCCVGTKEGADFTVYKGTCCPVMFQPVTKK